MIQIEKLKHKRQHITPWHQHHSGQLYWLKTGVILVETEQAQWMVTPGTIGWFPPSLPHRARVPDKLAGYILYLDPSQSSLFSDCAGLYAGDNFVMALLERLCLRTVSESPKDHQHNLLTLLSDEIALAPQLALQLNLPTDRRARNVADYLLEHSGSQLDQVQLAQKWGLSVRTLSRLFRQQTGLSFSQWRQQAKLISSLSGVMANEPISQVAMESGYTNVSAYIAAFRQRFGETPGQLQVEWCKL